MVERNAEMTLTDAAQRLGVSWTRAWRLVLVGELEGRRVGGRWLVSAESVERWPLESGNPSAGAGDVEEAR